ncbi:major pollen allergen Ole e 10-like [Mercurialis annua]|uniref:major pollen allergen Ole e 10-like n=1 Tax=Mercurialis annua TaxID=3986 RepID=UPI00215F7312|nr:major pollen allergen Ole e 10-like [Mercurialis annua]
MEPWICLRKLVIFLILNTIFVLNDAKIFPEKIMKKPKISKLGELLDPTKGEPYGLPSPFYLPSPAPLPLPALQNPLACVGSPTSPSIIQPFSPMKSPPKSPPMYIPISSPPQYELSPPAYVQPQPPPPAPQHKKAESGVWCVAKPSAADSIIKEALDYACGSGADCKPIQAYGPCFEPNTLVGHASYAFNSYWQKTKAAGGTCDFAATAIIVTVDPSFNNCHFPVN